MTRDRRLALGLLVAGAVLTVIASRDSWFSLDFGFYGPDATLMWVLDFSAAALALFALLALARRSAALAQLAAMAALMLSGALLVLLVVSGSGTDVPDRGGWLTAVAAAVAGGVGISLLTEGGPIGRRSRLALVLLVVATAVAAVVLPPDWSWPDVIT